MTQISLRILNYAWMSKGLVDLVGIEPTTSSMPFNPD